MVNRLGDPFAHVAPAAVAQFVGFMGAGAGAAGDNRSPHGSVLEHHLGFHRGIPAGIQYLSGHDGVDDEVEGVDHVGRGIKPGDLMGRPPLPGCD